MDWVIGIQKAINYIEEHLTEEIDYEEVAAQSFSSGFHFQRVFSILCGFTLGEYIRNRRLSQAGAELTGQDVKVIDVALKYGYESPDSFAKAFQKFHGVTPSEAKRDGCKLKSFSRLNLKITLKGGSEMNYRIEEKESMILTGYKKRFTGVPYGKEREQQEGNFFVTTRAKQWLLRGAGFEAWEIDFCVVNNMDDEGYDFYIAYKLNEWTREHLYDKEVTGVDFMDELGFENIIIPKQTYVVFETTHQKYPMEEYRDIRERLVSEWLPGSGYEFSEGPELALVHWRTGEQKDQRFVEIWIPVKKVK